MERILEVLLPVLIMMLIGMVCRRKAFISKSCVDGLKFITTKIILPVAVFNALSTADFSVHTILIVAVMLGAIIVSFIIGFLARKLFKEPYSKYVPYMITIYEGGMVAYPLYTNLAGAENLSNMALLDISGLLFFFSVFMGILNQTENNERTSIKKICTDALKSPAFLATVAGIISGITGVVDILKTTSFGGAYEGMVNIITVPLSSIIMLVVGYEIEFKKKLLKPCIQMIVLRAVVQALMIAAVMYCIHLIDGKNRLVDIAILIYMSAPASFSMQSFVKKKEGSEFVATTNSLYCLVSIIVYAVVAAVV